MKVLNKCFVFLELLVQFWSVGSYTVVLKQVKPLYPPVKVYRYELHPKILSGGNTYIYQKPLGQRVYPVAVQSGKDGNYKTRVHVKTEKGKHQKVISTTEKVSSGRLSGLSQHLVPPVSNQIEEYSEAKEEENDIGPLAASTDTGKSFSSFGQQKGRIYINPGEWATPVPKAESENTSKAEFTPSQLYLQIRHKNSVIHVPQSEALKDAETLEELINAPRLKQLSRTTHVQETYSEEGYEDAGYDHAGHLRQAQHGEVYDAKDEGVFKIKEPPVILDYDSDSEESKKLPIEETREPGVLEGNLTNKLEPRITHSKSEVSKISMEYTPIPKNYKGDHKYSSRVKKPLETTDENNSGFNLTKVQNLENVPPTFPSYFGEMPPTSESTHANESLLSLAPPAKISSKYRKNDLNLTKISSAPDSASHLPHQVNEYTDFKPYLSIIDSQASPSTKSLKYSRIYSKKTKQLRLEPYKNENAYLTPPLSTLTSAVLPPYPDFQTSHQSEKTMEEEPVSERIVLPTIGYINSLTTAHFAKGNTKPVQDESKTQLTHALNLTQALNYLRSNKNQKNIEVTKAPSEIDIRTFEPMRIKKSRSGFIGKTKRDVYLMGERGRSDDGIPKVQDTEKEDYEGNDESDTPHNEKNREIAENEKKRIEEENREKEKYESNLREEISTKEREIIKETYKIIGAEEDVSEVFPEFPYSDPEPDQSFILDETSPAPVNVRKYPFYKSKRLPENSALRYATDPRQFPKKSGHKMEFYESRERFIQCPDFHPDMDNLQDSNSTEYSDDGPTQVGNGQRLTGLGDKILCLRMKYFDPEPFDNPIFKETEIDYVGKPVKGRKKVKITQKTLRIKKDQTPQQTGYQRFYAAKRKNPKPNAQIKSIASSVKKHYIDQPINVQVFSLQSNITTETPRIIPVTEIIDELPSQQIKPYQGIQKSPVTGWKTTYRSVHSPRLNAQTSEIRKKIAKPLRCLPVTSRIVALDTKISTTDCNDAIFIQDIVNKVGRARIIPKTKKQAKSAQRKRNEKMSEESPYQNDWKPISSYTLPKHLSKELKIFSRKTDEVTGLKNNTIQNNTAVYVIDELKEDEKVRKGEVVEDMDHYIKMIGGLKDEIMETTTTKAENSTRRKREALNDAVEVQKQNNFEKTLKSNFDSKPAEKTSGKSETGKTVNVTKSKLFERKRPLARLSGLDFLTRYHKNRDKPNAQKMKDFWKVTAVEPITSKDTKKLQEKRAGSENPLQTAFKNKDKFDRTKSSLRVLETITKIPTIKNPEIKGAPEPRKNSPNTSGEKANKPKTNQPTNKPINEPRKVSLLNLVPEKITKKPEVKASSFWKTFNQNTEKITPKSVNFTKIITKVSKETSESSEKPRIVLKKSNSSQTSFTENRTSLSKPEVPQYKTFNRSSTLPINSDSKSFSRTTKSPGGPILYYVVNSKTGRGKWITNYNEQRGKCRKHEKLKDCSGGQTDRIKKL